MTTTKHFWSGLDTAGRSVRAYFITKHMAGISIYTKLPAVVFRALKAWEREAGFLEVLRTAVADSNAWRTRQAASAGKTSVKLRRQPRAKGATWNIVAVVPLDELARVRTFATPLGLEPKFRPNMARLSVEQIGVIAVELAAWMDSGRAA